MRNAVIGKEWRASCEYSEYSFPFHTLHFDFVCCALAYSPPTFGLDFTGEFIYGVSRFE